MARTSSSTTRTRTTKSKSTKSTAVKKTTAKKATKSAKKRRTNFMVGLHLPGQLVRNTKVNSDMTFGEYLEAIKADNNVTDYVGYLIRSGESFSEGKAANLNLQKGDLIRIGIKTKNN